jgi:hypothetical protein
MGSQSKSWRHWPRTQCVTHSPTHACMWHWLTGTTACSPPPSNHSRAHGVSGGCLRRAWLFTVPCRSLAVPVPPILPSSHPQLQYHSWAQRGAGEQAMGTVLAPGARARIELEPRLTVASLRGAPLTFIYGEPHLDWWVPWTRTHPCPSTIPSQPILSLGIPFAWVGVSPLVQLRLQPPCHARLLCCVPVCVMVCAWMLGRMDPSLGTRITAAYVTPGDPE